MKKIVITQRVMDNSSYFERNDLLDQRWISFLQELGFWVTLMPNNLEYAKKMFSFDNFDGILLTGGNSLVRYGGDAPERDEVEEFLLDLAYKYNLPVLGICRGMQVIQNFFSNNLAFIEGHVNTRHSLEVVDGHRLSHIVNEYKDVNSYFTFGSTVVVGDLKKVAQTREGVIMSVEHCEKPIYGIMWHPEREKTINVSDIKLFNLVFGD